uniref:Voltage-dependent anion-selective channel protein 2 n=1 Tax=Schistocephalus solidus TaxID=70667 RepID=A0A0X3Q2E1_SCHSO
MSPPSYPDISKAVRDFLKKNYNFGTIFFSHKGNHDFIDFTTRIDSLTDAHKTFGSIESKFKVEDYGFTLCEKWNTRDAISADLTFEDRIINGLKQTFRMTYDTFSGRTRAFVRNNYKAPSINAHLDFALKSSAPDVSASCVIGCVAFT